MRPGRREGDDLGVDALLLEDALTVGDVAMAAYSDVVVTGIMHARIPLGVDGQRDGAVSRLEGIKVFRRIEVVVYVYDRCGSHHEERSDEGSVV